MKKQTSKKTEKSKMTMDKLALIMESGFAEQDKKTDEKIEDLAEMVQRGFIDQAERFDNKLQNFATKDDLKKLENRFGDLENHFKNLEDQVLTGFDKILGKLDKMDQENIVHDYKHKRIDEILEIHDSRIKKIETKK